MTEMQIGHEPIYCLIVALRTGGEIKIYGNKTPLKSHLERWAKREWIDQHIELIEGVCDSADRSSLTVAVLLDDVQAMMLFGM